VRAGGGGAAVARMIGWRIDFAIAGLVMIAALLLDYKDSRYCEGCDLATQARSLGYVPGGTRDPR
jgi:hypothetical protein